MAIWRLEETTLLFYDMSASESEPSLVFPLSNPGRSALGLTTRLAFRTLEYTDAMEILLQGTTEWKQIMPPL